MPQKDNSVIIIHWASHWKTIESAWEGAELCPFAEALNPRFISSWVHTPTETFEGDSSGRRVSYLDKSVTWFFICHQQIFISPASSLSFLYGKEEWIMTGHRCSFEVSSLFSAVFCTLLNPLYFHKCLFLTIAVK